MAGELWDLTELQERIAAALWRHEAERAAPLSVVRRRTLSAFKDEAHEERDVFLGRAGAALQEILACDIRRES